MYGLIIYVVPTLINITVCKISTNLYTLTCLYFEFDMGLGVYTSGQCFRTLLFMLHTSQLFHIVGNHIVGYTDDTTIYAVIPKPLSHPQVMISLNQDLRAKDYWSLKRNVKLNPQKTNSMVVIRSWTNAPGYGDLTLGGAELENVKSLQILEVTFDNKLTFKDSFAGSCVEGSQESGCRAPGRKVI